MVAARTAMKTSKFTDEQIALACEARVRGIKRAVLLDPEVCN
jgi:hypothetical protein